jgi:pyrroline-5-carboxylate reductase
MRIVFIGAGKMAEALIARLGAPGSIVVSDKEKSRLSYLRAKYKVKVARDNLEAFRSGDVVILAVKPQNMAEVLAEVQGPPRLRSGSRVGKQKLVISIAAGIPLSYLQKKLPGYSIVRAMPNNPCMVGAGITALAKGKGTRNWELGIAKRLFEAVGEVVEVPEKWMDAVTGLSGSGPAFVYLVIEALAAGGIASGLPGNAAAKLAVQTVLGAAQTVKMTGRHPRQLRAMVTSPGGTTIEGLAVLAKFKTAKALSLAVVAASKKSKILSKRWAH